MTEHNLPEKEITERLQKSLVGTNLNPDRPFEVRPGVFVETVSIDESSNDAL